MPFDTVLGQERAKQALRQAIRAGRVPHAVLMTGPEGSGKAALALALARAVNCDRQGEEPCDACPSCHRILSVGHADVHILFPCKRSRRESEDVDPEDERKFLSALAQDPYRYPETGPSENILIDRVRRLEGDLARGLFEGRCRVAILLGADRMRQETANALLKTLEEPLPGTLLILVTARPGALLPTVRSRCQQVRLAPLAESDIRLALRKAGEVSESRLALTAKLSQGSLRAAYGMLGQDVEGLREQAFRFLHDGIFGGDTALFPAVEKLGAGGGDRKGAEGLFDACAVWMRDVALFQAGCRDRLANADRAGDVEKLAGVLDAGRAAGALREMEACRDMSRRNVNLSLILIAFWRHLRRFNRAA